MDIGFLELDQLADITDCREAILSNDYADYVVTYNGDRQALIDELEGQCLKLIDDYLAVVTIARKAPDLIDLVPQLYSIIPK